MSYQIMVLPGDGIGPEVTVQARRVLDWLIQRRGLDIEVLEDLYGAAAHAEYGRIIAADTHAATLAADAVLFGAVGGPAYDALPAAARREGNLLQLRQELQIFANLRPIVGYAETADASALKPEVVAGVDVLVVRELNGGIYFGQPRGISDLPDGQKQGLNTLVYTTSEIERIARVAFGLARRRRGRLTSVDKRNVLETSILWREVVGRLGAEEFPDVELDHILVDNCAMQLASNPGQFDVLLCDNMFGDILSDIGGATSGSLGMLPSASLGAPDADGRRKALYEPMHGSAPDIAGRGVANPSAAILSVAMLFEHSLGLPEDAAQIDRAVRAALGAGIRTPDVARPGVAPVSTTEFGDAVISQLDQQNHTT